MTPKQILDSFSETLLQDERILSPQERQLLTKVLSHAKDAAGENEETQEAVQKAIATAVGETVAQRAFSVLGGSIVERILQGSRLAPENEAETPAKKKPPQQPAKTPSSSPGVRTNPVPPAPSPGPQGPQGPQGSVDKVVKSEAALSVQERPPQLKARCVVLDEFLAPQDVEQLTRFALERENDFRTSEVISPIAEGGVVDYEHRRSRVLMEIGPYQQLVLTRIKAVLPEVLKKLGM